MRAGPLTRRMVLLRVRQEGDKHRDRLEVSVPQTRQGDGVFMC